MDPILIVDDEKDNLEALQRLLRNAYAVTAVTSPFEALKLVQKTPYHVIVSDQRMPEMSGVELLEKVKKLSPSTTRILLTGYTEIESVIEAINRGNVYRYVAKPWDPEDLRLTLKQANEAFQLRRDLEKKSEALQKSNVELKQALEDLTLLDRAKARFLSLVSHELNTPLTVVNSFVELLSERKSDLPEDVQKAINSLSKASQRFSDIIGEVLTYVKLEAETQLKLESFSWAQEIHSACQELGRLAAPKNIQFVERAEKDLSSSCDIEKMRLVIRKLASDALTHAPPKSSIEIGARREKDEILFYVSRSGDAPSQDPFAPLETLGNEWHHQKDLGMSLAICRLIAESHHGKARSQFSSQRITFEILLPSR